MCDRDKPELTLDELIGLMSGGAELDALRHELAAAPRPENGRGWGGGG